MKYLRGLVHAAMFTSVLALPGCLAEQGTDGSVEQTDEAATAATYAFQTSAGGYLSMVLGGGLGGPNTGPGSVALHTDATAVGPWETFTWIGVDPNTNKFALLTVNGDYITAVNGGNMGGPNDSSSPVHTDAAVPGPWEALRILPQPNGKVAIQTATGNYLTAVMGGGYGGPNIVPIHTDATAVGPWETFTLVKP